jgi:predicted acyltransferase
MINDEWQHFHPTYFIFIIHIHHSSPLPMSLPNSQRLVALDVFRGLTIALMFTVNNPGTWSFIYPPLEHAKWSGWTPTDFVYPFFLFTVGVAAWFSLKKYQNGAPRALYFKIIKRGMMIFAIGLGLTLYLNSLTSYHNLRIMGVLQRIGIAYMLGTLICVSFNKRNVAIIAAAILLGYWALMYFFSDPTYPFGFHDGAQYLGIENNIVTKFDRWILGASHLYKGYGGIPFDPEGLLSTLPAVVSVILGYFTGMLVDSKPDRRSLVKVMFLWGIAALSVGQIWDFAFPINKPIWSSSYVVFMAGFSLVINAALIWLIDVQGWRGWTKPILVLGMNSLLAFIIAGVYVKTISKIKFDSSYETVTQAWNNNAVVPKRIGGYQKLYETYFSPLTTDFQTLKKVKDKVITEKNTPSVWADFKARQKLSSLLFALFHVLLFWSILWIFYKFNIFLKV